MDLSAISPLLAAEAARVAEPNDPTAALDAATPAVAPPAVASDTFRDILSHFDVTHITPREFSELVQKLHSAGAIDEAQLRELSLIRGDLDAARLEADEPVDLVEFYAQRLEEQAGELARLSERAKKNPQVSADVETALTSTRTRLDWMQRFARANSGIDVPGLDVLV